MPNTKSAIKAMKQAIRRKKGNVIKKDAFKKAIKEVKKLILDGKKNEAIKALSKAMSTLDKAAKTNVIHKNKSSRLKSRLSKAISKIK